MYRLFFVISVYKKHTMNEKLLQYLWNYKVFKKIDFKDTYGNPIEILDFGKWNHDSGPDFLYAKIKTKELVLAGNIELHVRSSDWIFHQHSSDSNFENIILHVVYLNDTEIDEFKKKNIPTLELKEYIDSEILLKHELLMQENRFIVCEKIFDPDKIPFGFCEETILSKLDEKSIEIETHLRNYKNDYEATLFHLLAYSFGLKINARIFQELAENIDFAVIRKICQNKNQLEALLFGKCGWLENPTDGQMKTWQREYSFIAAKHGVSSEKFSPKFSRLRPPNFPTIRLSQLANLYSRENHLFSKIINAETSEHLHQIFNGVAASEYWDFHFTFNKKSQRSYEKTLTKDFVDLIILNAILPLKYTYHKHQNENIAEEIIAFYKDISAEKNTLIDQWKNLEIIFKNALESQSFIYHFKKFCSAKNCLNCSIGFQLLKSST